MKRASPSARLPRLKKAQAAFAAGALEQAESACRALLADWPDDPDGLLLLSRIALACGDEEAAASLLLRSTEVAPGRADLHLALGRTLLLAGRAVEAVGPLRSATSLAPDRAETFFALGEALHATGDLPAAAEAYAGAQQLEPSSAQILNNLGSVLADLGRADEAWTMFEQARVLAPALAQVHANLGCLASQRGRHDEAISALERAIQLEPSFARARMNLATALKGAGRTEEALAAYERAARAAPDDGEVFMLWARLHLERGEAPAALAVCDAFLARHPGHAGLLARKAIALDAAGDRRGCRALVDFDRFVRVTRVSPPEGWPDLATFNAALARHVQQHPSLSFAPARHATQQGYHSGSLLAEPRGPIAALESLIEQAVVDYGASRPQDAAHPFLAHRPDGLSLNVWGVVMPALGHQLPHVHPSGWLSGCYYVQIPPVVRSTRQHEGWLEFGRPDDPRLSPVDPETHLVQPEEGLLVLFPSYFFHRTIPFQGEAHRISIAFDAMPTDRS